jgi:FdhE protein
MAVAVATDPWTERRRRLAELRLRQGFARQLLDFHGALLGVQERAFHEARANPPSAEMLASYVAEVVVPAVVDVSVMVGPDRLRSKLIRRLETELPVRIVQRWIAGDPQSMVDRYLARATLGPVLEALDPQTRATCGGDRDGRHCPECAGPPQLSFFVAAGEDLATGPRYLECARCASSWAYPRMTCAGCGEDTSARLSVFSEHGASSGERGSVVRGLPADPSAAIHDRAVFPHMRIEACESCRQYLLSIDLAAEPAAVPVVDELAAIPLDLFAREKGFTKITTNLMGF